MRLLISTVLLFLIISCGPGGPITPVDAFYDMRHALQNTDHATVLKLFSDSSRRSIDEMCREIRKMDPKTLSSVAYSKGVEPRHISGITPEIYVRVFFINDKEKTSASRMFQIPVSGVQLNGDTAEVILKNGMRLPFIKEGPYWRFELSSL